MENWNELGFEALGCFDWRIDLGLEVGIVVFGVGVGEWFEVEVDVGVGVEVEIGVDEIVWLGLDDLDGCLESCLVSLTELGLLELN